MKKILIIGGIVLFIAAAAAGIMLISGEDENSNTNQAEDSQQTDNNQAENVFSAVPTDDQEYEATMSGESDGTNFEAVILSDGQGNSKYSGQSNGETFEMYNLEDGSTIVCNAGSCFKMSGSAAQTPVSSEQYEYSDESLADFRDKVTYKGQESCPAGTCSVWEFTEDGVNVRVYLASDNRISKLTSAGEGANFEIVYDYKDVSIDVPANVQEFPGQ